jgi:DNA-binding NtrC family response regulator
MDDIGLLVGYPWPGNVREFATVIERAAILGEGRRLEIARALGLPGRISVLAALPRRDDVTGFDAFFPSLDQAILRHIEVALVRSRGRIEGPDGAAGRLSVNPHTLRSRMRKLGIDWRSFRPKSNT